MPRPKLPRDKNGKIIRKTISVEKEIEPVPVETVPVPVPPLEVPPPKVSTHAYRVSLKVNNHIIEGSGETLVGVLRSLRPEHYKTVGIISAHFGEKKCEEVLSIREMRRLSFQSEIPCIVLAKKLEMRMK